MNANYSLFILCGVVFVLTPGMVFLDHNLWVSLQLFIPTLLVTIYLGFRGSILFPKQYWPFLAFPVAMICLILLALIVSINRAITSDFFELLRPTATLIFLVFFISTFYDSRFNLNRYVYGPLAFVTVFFFAIFFFQLVGVPYLENIHSLYIREKPILRGKFVGPFSTTYAAGFYFVVCFSLFFARALLIRAGRAKYAILSLLSAFLVLFTQSRSAFMGLFVAFSFMLILVFLNNLRGWLLLFLFVIIGSSIIFFTSQIFIDYFPYLAQGLVRFVFDFESNVGGDNSLGTRVSQIRWALENNSYIAIGAGILKDEVRLLESWFALYYFRYGILGMSFYLLFWFGLGFFALISFVCNFKIPHKDWRSFILGFIGIIAALPFGLMSSIPTEFMTTLILWVMLSSFTICYVFSRRSVLWSPYLRFFISRS
jgi:hypothetical protein